MRVFRLGIVIGLTTYRRLRPRIHNPSWTRLIADARRRITTFIAARCRLAYRGDGVRFDFGWPPSVLIHVLRAELVRSERVELSWPFDHDGLNVACIPVSTRIASTSGENRTLMGLVLPAGIEPASTRLRGGHLAV